MFAFLHIHILSVAFSGGPTLDKLCNDDGVCLIFVWSCCSVFS